MEAVIEMFIGHLDPVEGLVEDAVELTLPVVTEIEVKILTYTYIILVLNLDWLNTYCLLTYIST